MTFPASVILAVQRTCYCFAVAVTTIFPASFALANESAFSQQIVGDVGGALYRTTNLVRGTVDKTMLPYAYFDYGGFFARVDTFGFKAMPLGIGFVEVVGRVSLEGFKGNAASGRGINDRGNPLPIGLGSHQQTSIGDFFVYGFHDFTSGGSLFESDYAVEFKVGSWVFYPSVGVEYRSARYVRHLYGVSSENASAGAYTVYSPGASLAPNLGLALEIPITGNWILTAQLRRKWFDNAVTSSPLVNRKSQDSSFIALNYRFE
jgi:outer membrane protein